MFTSFTTHRTTFTHHTTTINISLCMDISHNPSLSCGIWRCSIISTTWDRQTICPDFKGRRLLSTTLVCRAGDCPLKNDAKASMLYLTEMVERKTCEKEKTR